MGRDGRLSARWTRLRVLKTLAYAHRAERVAAKDGDGAVEVIAANGAAKGIVEVAQARGYGRRGEVGRVGDTV